MNKSFIEALNKLEGKSSIQNTDALRSAFQSLPEDNKKLITEVLSPVLTPPDEKSKNKIWLIIIWACSIVMVGSFIILGLGAFIEFADPAKGTKPELILVVFTTVTGFLFGLVSPSPVGKKG
jgi:hypothetical protein